MATAFRQVTPVEPERETRDDPLVAALEEAVAVVQEVARTADDLIVKAQALITSRREGREWEEILCDEETPLLSALLARTADAIGHANSRVRRAQIDVLYGSGMAMHRIGNLLGITRQRVAALLNASMQPPGAPNGEG
jgi:hypothetical protein